MMQDSVKRDIVWIKPVQLKKPAREMSDEELVDALNRWENEERIAHARFDNNKGSSCYIYFLGCWRKCQRLVKELEDEMDRRLQNASERLYSNDSR